MKTIVSRPEIGQGIYTTPEISLILGIPQNKIRRYINEVWDNRFGEKLFNQRYSWEIGKNKKAVNFHVLIEFFVVLQLRNEGIPTRTIFKARKSIAEELHVAYPFASSKLLHDGKKIWYLVHNDIVNADGTKQLNFPAIIKKYCRKIQFGDNNLAERLWPIGKNNSIVVDPHHQFGQPVIEGTNIVAEVIYSMYNAGESVKTLCLLYDITEKQVKDAVKFYSRVA